MNPSIQKTTKIFKNSIISKISKTFHPTKTFLICNKNSISLKKLNKSSENNSPESQARTAIFQKKIH